MKKLAILMSVILVAGLLAGCWTPFSGFEVNLAGDTVYLEKVTPANLNANNIFQLEMTFDGIDVTNSCDYEFLQTQLLPIASVDQFGLITAGNVAGTDGIKITHHGFLTTHIMSIYVVVE